VSERPGPDVKEEAMTTPDPATDLDAYLRQYRDKFTREAMAAKLIEAGHDPDAIDAALQRVEAEREAVVADALAAADADEARARGTRRVVRGIFLVVYALAAFWLTAPMLTDSPGAIGPVLIGLVALVGLGLAWLLGRTRNVAVMLTWCLAAIVLGLPLALFGACLAGLGSGTVI
jgi:hypothetical protein